MSRYYHSHKNNFMGVVAVQMLSLLLLMSLSCCDLEKAKTDFSQRHLEATETINRIYSFFGRNGRWPMKTDFDASGRHWMPPDWQYEGDPDQGGAVIWLHGPLHMIISYRFLPPEQGLVSNVWSLSFEGDKSTFQADVDYSLDLDDERDPDTIKDERKSYKKWELLEMTDGLGGVLPSEQRTIKRIKITFIAKDASPWKAGIVGNNPLVHETDDPRVLKAITRFLCFPLCHAVSENVHVGSCGRLLGTMVVTTSKDEFTVYITQLGFQLEDSSDLHTTFYSWGLAHFMDDLCVHKLNVHIPPDIMQNLTGESTTNLEKKILQRLNEQRREDIEKTDKQDRRHVPDSHLPPS